MQENTASQEKLNIYVKHTVDSGVKPIELLFQPIYDCYYGEETAYRVIARVNSIVTGVLNPDDYLNGLADENLLNEFTFRTIKKALNAQKALEKSSVAFKRLYVRCPSSFLYAENLYTDLKILLAENGVKEQQNKLCLEFDGAAMDTESEKLKESFSDIRAAGIKIAVNGYGGQAFSMEKLLTVCPDYLFADESAAKLAVDREKRSALAPLINFAKSLGAEIVACGISTDEELREFRTRESFGFTPNKNYKGAFTVESDIKSLASLVAKGGENA